jgi:hypothetical protein
MTAKRPSLSTHPPQPLLATLMGGSTLQVHAAFCAPSSEDTRVDAGNPAAAKYERVLIRLACGVHMPVARSTNRTDEVSM